jgi:hypothetical protein
MSAAVDFAAVRGKARKAIDYSITCGDVKVSCFFHRFLSKKSTKRPTYATCP